MPARQNLWKSFTRPAHTPWHITYFERTGVDPLKCLCCAEGRLQLTAVVSAPGVKLNPEVRLE
jgi:hypothetical protein